ncbi:hypothetical protein QG071_01000 [Kingella kingae]|uniref:hypothetical protein n=1 Tax=Kingella kingae TaxID=504 RepID=UPI002551B144|nr:hypothetical protein [Kingella kingae]MDK4583728.1 hypothetical protein [Kingella kingae]MDK4600412.1 hypothetical protein [Kingella kingae]MDK4609872.1 hypothetical protein [Kingella kingae]MDK4654161.1 hypothetical protein [Kingella kingae]MDK4657556.1 hypothetical protein [Kingella kingae]
MAIQSQTSQNSPQKLWRFLNITLPKYKGKIPMSKEQITEFLTIFEMWLKKHESIESNIAE